MLTHNREFTKVYGFGYDPEHKASEHAGFTLDKGGMMGRLMKVTNSQWWQWTSKDGMRLTFNRESLAYPEPGWGNPPVWTNGLRTKKREAK